MRWSGLAALLGGLLCLLLTPIQASIFSGADSPPLVLATEPLLDLADTIHGTFGPRLGLDEYYFYGRMFFLVYLGATGLDHAGASPPRRRYYRLRTR